MSVNADRAHSQEVGWRAEMNTMPIVEFKELSILLFSALQLASFEHFLLASTDSKETAKHKRLL